MTSLAEAVLAHHLRFNPVDATFMGIPGHDHELPPADAEAASREADAARALLARTDEASGLDARMIGNVLGLGLRMLEERPRFADPTWYSGETVFGLISVMLPNAIHPTSDDLAARIAGIPRFLREGTAQLAGASAFSGWTARARTEIRAAQRLLRGGMRLHPLWRETMPVDAAVAALGAFDEVVAGLPDADPRCGPEYLAFLMRDVHAHPLAPMDAVAAAEETIVRVRDDLVTSAQKLDPSRSWQEQLADLNRIAPDAERIPESYREQHERAMAEAAHLLTPATEYGLEFKPFPEWARDIHRDLYFIAYRCPPGADGGGGSVYWTSPPGQSLATIKSTHAVHHGSVGHHTQNARARAAPSLLARVANQGVARGIAFQAGLTMGEGWACYVQDLMAEVDGFYTPAEILLMKSNELRNAACLVADIRFHSRAWDLERMRAYYRDVAGFPAARVDFETVKNSIFPANRAMYWLGVEQIKQARARWPGTTRDFHDGLIARGHVPLAWAIEDMAARDREPPPGI